MKKIISLFVCFALVFSSLAVNAFALEVDNLIYHFDVQPNGEVYDKETGKLCVTGWAFDKSGETVRCYYSIDGGEGSQATPVTRNDIPKEYPDICTQPDTGVDEFISVSSLDIGEHTFRFYALAGTNESTLFETTFIVGAFRYSCDETPKGKYSPNDTSGLLAHGWVFNKSNVTTSVFYQIDDNPRVEIAMRDRIDVFGLEGNTQLKCGYEVTVPITDFSVGTHTFKIIAVCSLSEKVIAQTNITIESTAANFKFSPDFRIEGTYTWGTTELVHLGGWAYNANGQATECYYQIDDGVLYKLTPDNRYDVYKFADCTQLDCGYQMDISIADVGRGPHTYRVIAKSGNVSQVLSEFDFEVISLDGELKYNPEQILSGTYVIGSEDGNYGDVHGWGYNSSGAKATVYGQFDNGDWFYVTSSSRPDVIKECSDCYRTDCGYYQLIYLGNLSAGTHTITLYLSSGDKTAVIDRATFVVQKSQYTVNFNGNGGTGVPGQMIKAYGKNLSLPTTGLTKQNYVFKEWNTEQDGSGKSYTDSYTQNANATLYAIWVPVNAQEGYDTDFTIAVGESASDNIMFNGALASATVASSTSSVTVELNAACSPFNYYGVHYSSDAYVGASFNYKINGTAYSEEFFLEPGQDKEFRSFIDGVFDKTTGSEVVSVTFKPLSAATFNFSVTGIAVFRRVIPDNVVYFQNDYIKIGLNMKWGGGLSYYEDLDSNVQAVSKDGIIRIDTDASEKYSTQSLNNHVNLVNCHDTGRLIQQSYYGTENYDMGFYNGHFCSYNPVQGGNQFNDSSKIVDLQITEDTIYIKCRPLDWAKEKEYITDSYMEATYTLEGSTLKTDCRFVDFSGYDSVYGGQEIPAFYGAATMDTLLYYEGDDPWSGGELSELDKLDEYEYAHYPDVSPTECWGALTSDPDDPTCFSIGLYVPGCEYMLAGVSGSVLEQSENPDISNPTSYLAGGVKMLFASYSPIEYSYYVTTGTVNEIRHIFRSIANVGEDHAITLHSDETGHWYECETCGYKISQFSHVYRSSHDDTQHWKTCIICEYISEREDHNYDEFGVCECGFEKLENFYPPAEKLSFFDKIMNIIRAIIKFFSSLL